MSKPPAEIILVPDDEGAARALKIWKSNKKDPAFGEFLDQCAPYIKGVIHRRGIKDTNVCNDIMQNVRTQLIASFTYNPEKGGFKNWLACVARNNAVTHFRQEGRRTKAEHEKGKSNVKAVLYAHKTDPVAKLIDGDQFGLLETYLKSVGSEEEEKIFRYRRIEELTSEQTGELLGLTDAEVNNKLFAFINKLKTAIAAEVGGYEESGPPKPKPRRR